MNDRTGCDDIQYEGQQILFGGLGNPSQPYTPKTLRLVHFDRYGDDRFGRAVSPPAHAGRVFSL